MQYIKICIIAIVAITIVPFANSAKLPSYIQKCSASDPKLAQCVNDRMYEVLPRIVKGSKEFQIPKLSPFYLKEIVVEATKSLTLKLTDIYVYGLENAKFSNVLCDLESGKGGVDISFESLYVNATYDVDGQILVLPIKGYGPLQISIKNAKFAIKFRFDTKDKNGVKYFVLKDPSLKLTTEDSHFHFDNLFNGNKELGDQINNFLEENRKDVGKDIEPAVSRAVLTIYMSILQRMTETIPIADIIDP